MVIRERRSTRGGGGGLGMKEKGRKTRGRKQAERRGKEGRTG